MTNEPAFADHERTTGEIATDQSDNPNPLKYEVREVPAQAARLLFPLNHMSAQIVGERVKVTASVDHAAIEELIERLGLLKAVLARGPMPRPND